MLFYLLIRPRAYPLAQTRVPLPGMQGCAHFHALAVLRVVYRSNRTGSSSSDDFSLENCTRCGDRVCDNALCAADCQSCGKRSCASCFVRSPTCSFQGGDALDAPFRAASERAKGAKTMRPPYQLTTTLSLLTPRSAPIASARKAMRLRSLATTVMRPVVGLRWRA